MDTWTANTTQEEFKQVLESICKRMDKPERVKHCLHIVDDWYMHRFQQRKTFRFEHDSCSRYIPWFQYLLHEINPRQICSLVGLCGNSGFMRVSKLRVYFVPVS